MDAVILARVSSKEQEDGLSLDAQSARLTEYATKRGFNIVKTFVLTESSCRGNRRGFHDCIKYLKHTSAPTCLIADAVDRVQRTFSEIGMLDELRKKKNIELHFYRENLVISNSASSQDIMRWEFAVLAAHSYVLSLSENVKRSIGHKYANGEISGHAPLGYKNIRTASGSDIVPDEKIVPYIVKMFETYARGGQSYKSIAHLANTQWGLRTARFGKRLDAAKVQYILSNRFYYGEYERNGKIYPLRYKPIISRELWDQCERVRMGRAAISPKKQKIDSPYRGLIKCVNSGRLCQIETHKGRLYLVSYTPDGKRKYTPMAEIDAQVAQILDSIKPTPECLAYAMDMLKTTKHSERDWHKSEIMRLRDELDVNQNRINGLLDLLIDKKITQDAYNTKFEQLTARVNEIKNMLNAHRTADDTFNQTVVNLLNLANSAGNLFIKSSNVRSRSDILKLVIRTMEFDGISIGYYLNFPFSEMQNLTDLQQWGTLLDNIRTSKSAEIRQIQVANWDFKTLLAA